ncbi:cysteine-rich CWC family protein [Cohnella nanjingensis]|uniref:Cysteine-rich CWC family protein n=1 Tax=Cohnella nanjingensis TaxID=1387779 RepID=A0A7X0RWG2_9BACL|nr:cysteine-rich CWC family protein [Cohnella nanjingensis]MBB6674855.1 cysteine-rich CWC family protein [Cohnella nanjingensis]
MHENIDPAICPVCGGDNGCALLAGQPIEQCWCMRTRIPKEVLSAIPAERRGKACVCQACAAGSAPARPD